MLLTPSHFVLFPSAQDRIFLTVYTAMAITIAMGVAPAALESRGFVATTVTLESPCVELRAS